MTATITGAPANDTTAGPGVLRCGRLGSLLQLGCLLRGTLPGGGLLQECLGSRDYFLCRIELNFGSGGRLGSFLDFVLHRNDAVRNGRGIAL